jgi:hypothetical protein
LNIRGICKKDVSGWTREFGITARVKKKLRTLSTGPIVLLHSRELAGEEARDLSLLNFSGKGRGKN